MNVCNVLVVGGCLQVCAHVCVCVCVCVCVKYLVIDSEDPGLWYTHINVRLHILHRQTDTYRTVLVCHVVDLLRAYFQSLHVMD